MNIVTRFLLWTRGTDRRYKHIDINKSSIPIGLYGDEFKRYNELLNEIAKDHAELDALKLKARARLENGPHFERR